MRRFLFLSHGVSLSWRRSWVWPCSVSSIKTSHGLGSSRHWATLNQQTRWPVSLLRTRTQSEPSGLKCLERQRTLVLKLWPGKDENILTDIKCSNINWYIYLPTHSYMFLFVSFFTQDAGCVPADQDLLLPLEGPEPHLSLSQETRNNCDEWSCRCCVQNRRPERRSSEPQWAACLHSACGPC